MQITEDHMQITKEMLLAKKAEINADMDQHLARVNQDAGALQVIDLLLAELDQEDAPQPQSGA